LLKLAHDAFSGLQIEIMSYFIPIKFDKLVKNRKSAKFVIPAKAGIQSIQNVMDPGACPGHDPGFAGVTTQETFYDPINIW
jgi:hypothetical protein